MLNLRCCSGYIYNNLIKNIENEVTTCSIFLDLAKAYDTIDRRILIAKLEKYGIRGVPLQLIKSFLTSRQQYTTMKSTKSATNKVLCGIPQTSTLGPLLFTIYINNSPLASDFKVHLFADDTVPTRKLDHFPGEPHGYSLPSLTPAYWPSVDFSDVTAPSNSNIQRTVFNQIL